MPKEECTWCGEPATSIAGFPSPPCDEFDPGIERGEPLCLDCAVEAHCNQCGREYYECQVDDWNGKDWNGVDFCSDSCRQDHEANESRLEAIAASHYRTLYGR